MLAFECCPNTSADERPLFTHQMGDVEKVIYHHSPRREVGTLVLLEGVPLEQPRWEAIREQLLKFEMYSSYGPAFLVSAPEKHAHLCTRRLMRDVIVNQKKKTTQKLPNCVLWCWLWSRTRVTGRVPLRPFAGLCLLRWGHVPLQKWALF